MTEEEAKSRRCPYLQMDTTLTIIAVNLLAQGNAVAASSAIEEFRGNNRCIASECMMWIDDGETQDSRRIQTGHCGLAK